MSFDPMLIYAHAAPEASSVMASLAVGTGRQLAFANMSKAAAPRTVVDLTLYEPRGQFTVSSLEFSISIAFDGCGEPSR